MPGNWFRRKLAIMRIWPGKKVMMAYTSRAKTAVVTMPESRSRKNNHSIEHDTNTNKKLERVDDTKLIAETSVKNHKSGQKDHVL